MSDMSPAVHATAHCDKYSRLPEGMCRATKQCPVRSSSALPPACERAFRGGLLASQIIYCVLYTIQTNWLMTVLGGGAFPILCISYPRPGFLPRSRPPAQVHGMRLLGQGGAACRRGKLQPNFSSQKAPSISSNTGQLKSTLLHLELETTLSYLRS